MENAKRTLSITANQNINEALMECNERNLPTQCDFLRIIRVSNTSWEDNIESLKSQVNTKQASEMQSTQIDLPNEKALNKSDNKKDLVSFSCPKQPAIPLLWDHVIEHKINNIEEGDRCEPYPSCGCPLSNNPAPSPRLSEYSIDFDTDSEDDRPACCNFTEYKINNLEGCEKNQAIPVCQGACEFRCIEGGQENSGDACLPYSLLPTLKPFSNKIIKEEQELSTDLVSNQQSYFETSV